MTLQARLTLWSILVMAGMVTVVSLSDLAGEVDGQFELTYSHGKSIGEAASEFVAQAVEADPSQPPTQAIAASKRLEHDFSTLSNMFEHIDEIVVTDANHIIIAHSGLRKKGERFEPSPEFGPLVRTGRIWTRWRVLSSSRALYQISDEQKDRDHNPLTVFVLIDPALMRGTIAPILEHHALIAVFSVMAAVIAAFLFSTIAFRPLGRLGDMLDRVSTGEFEIQHTPSPESNSDEFGEVASKVSLLGERLRGAESEFSDLKGNFERLLNDLEDGVLIFGRDRRLIASAGAVHTFLGGDTDLLGQPITAVFPPTTTLGLLLARAMQTGQAIRNRAIPIDVEHGAEPRAALVTVEFLGESSGLLIRLRDPEATRQIGRQLQTADRLSAISRLTGGVAHEVKNPLNAMLMHVELAKLKLAHGDHDLEPQMDVLASEILRLDRVVKTFLDFTRPVQLNLTDVPLNDFLNDLAELARPQAVSSGIDVIVDTSLEPAGITIDPDLFKQAALNIVINGIEAMPSGGTLKFESLVEGDQAEIRISDTGPGIPQSVREKIFDLYFTTKQKGSGIGLSMTYRIVQLHDGAIDFQSGPGIGTTFSLRLPLAVLQHVV